MRMKKMTDLLSVHNVSEHDNRNNYDMKSLSHVEKTKQGKITKISGSGDYSEDYKKALKAHTKDKKKPMVQKTSIPGWNIVMTATSFESIDQTKWIEANQKWLKETFGESNVHTLVLHEDETTPHLHCFVTPFHYSEKLKRYISGAKHWTGGPLAMRKLQDSYYESVSKLFGLARGEAVEQTHAKHTEPQVFREAQKNTYEKKRRSFEEWWSNQTPKAKFEWAFKAQLKLEELDQNDKRYDYFKTNLEKIKKSNPQLMEDLEVIFSNAKCQKMQDLKYPVVKDANTGKSQVDIPTAMATSFKLGAMFGAFFGLAADNEQVQFGGMNIIDFYMKVLGLDMDQAKKLAEKKKQNQEL